MYGVFQLSPLHALFFTDNLQVSRTLSLNFTTRYRIAQKLGPYEKKSFKALADECNLDESDMRRMLRLAMTDHLFDEPEKNMVAHTKASLALVSVPNLDAWTENFTVNSAYMMEVRIF